MPDVITSGDGDKYIGYEYIGETYSGNRKYIIEESDMLFANEISKLTGQGVFLDLACGDGCFTVPCATNGTRIIAGDISNNMLNILQEKAKHNNINLDNVTLCRMNALEIPLEDASVDTVAANSVLHLISNPEKVVREIYRVLKNGGAFICKDDTPGRSTATAQFDNSLYHEIVNSLYREYWNRLSIYKVYPQKYSWKFDRNAYCDKIFKRKNETLVDRKKVYEVPLKDGFIPRFLGRGFSDQVDVPKDLHEIIVSELLAVFCERYGDNFAAVTFKGIESDILITTYFK